MYFSLVFDGRAESGNSHDVPLLFAESVAGCVASFCSYESRNTAEISVPLSKLFVDGETVPVIESEVETYAETESTLNVGAPESTAM